MNNSFCKLWRKEKGCFLILLFKCSQKTGFHFVNLSSPSEEFRRSFKPHHPCGVLVITVSERRNYLLVLCCCLWRWGLMMGDR